MIFFFLILLSILVALSALLTFDHMEAADQIGSSYTVPLIARPLVLIGWLPTLLPLWLLLWVFWLMGDGAEKPTLGGLVEAYWSVLSVFALGHTWPGDDDGDLYA